MSFIGVSTGSAQVLVDSATIAITPYFEKNDTMIYTRDNRKITVNGNDSTTTYHVYERYMVVCKKASDKNGYLLEETPLEVKVLHKDPRGEMADKLTELMAKSFIGMKVQFTLSPTGDQLALANYEKVQKDAINRLGNAWDSVTVAYPLFKTFFPREAMTSVLQGTMSTPELMMENFKEMSQLFEFHGYFYEKDKDVTNVLKKEDDPTYTRDGSVTVNITAVPEEGQPVADWDDYSFRLASTEYKDALKATLQKAAEDNIEVTEEQLKALLKDKAPKGEVEHHEGYGNEYFGDGWPKYSLYITYDKMLEDGKEQLEIHELEWESKSTGNK